MRALVFCLALGVAGCATANTKPIDDAHRAKVEDENATYAGLRRYSSCDHRHRPTTCGLIADNAEFQQDVEALRVNVCALSDAEPLSDECAKEVVEMFGVRVSARYPLTDWSQVASYCRLHSDNCNSLRDMELVILASHNAEAEKLHGKALVDLQYQHDSAVAHERAVTAEKNRTAAVSAVAAGMQGFSDWMNRTQSAPAAGPSYRAPGLQSSSSDSCTSDYSCGPGRACVKNQYEMTGTCADTVNQYGVQTFGPADPSSVGVGHPDQCSFDTDCGVGFHCSKGSGIRGTCTK